MRYCQTCVLPNTRPNLKISEGGTCNCKLSNESSYSIDWEGRLTQFRNFIKSTRTNSEYDCIVPVSGGKDSTWQTLQCLDLGLRPLCITWKTPGRNSLGEDNLRNLIKLGVDHFDVTVNPNVDRIVVRKSFEENGSPAAPMHRLIRSIPIRMARLFHIPFVLDGENSAFEYGGSTDDFVFYMTNQWLRKYGVVGEIDLKALESQVGDARSLDWYQVPDLDSARSQGFYVLFASYFFRWSPEEAYQRAYLAGFKPAPEPIIGNWDFADIDDDFIIPVHHWMKWFKFGFTRRWDNLSIDIRSGKITRSEAIEILRSSPETEPRKAIELFLEYIGMSRSEFDLTCDKFRNPKVWKLNSMGKWEIRGFPNENGN